MALLLHAKLDTSSSGETAVVAAPGTGLRVKVYRLVLVNGAATAQTATIKDAASGNTLATIYLPSSIGGGVSLGNGDTSQCPEFVTADNGAFVVSLANATAVGGYIKYTTGG